MRVDREVRAPVLKLHITKEILERSRTRDSGYCMLAEALKIAFPDGRFASADIQTIRISDPARHRRYVYLTPRSAQMALIKFDRGELPSPFTIKLYNGQVTRMAGKKIDKIDKRSDKQKEGAVKAAGAARKVWSARLSARQHGLVPDKIGGTPPPLGELSSSKRVPVSRRRAFGLRALQE
jgi:hypothetical protein